MDTAGSTTDPHAGDPAKSDSTDGGPVPSPDVAAGHDQPDRLDGEDDRERNRGELECPHREAAVPPDQKGQAGGEHDWPW